jgi:hypothetical protein
VTQLEYLDRAIASFFQRREHGALGRFHFFARFAVRDAHESDLPALARSPI